MTVTWTKMKTMQVPVYLFTWSDVDAPEHCGVQTVLEECWIYPPGMPSLSGTTALLDFRCPQCFEHMTVSSRAETEITDLLERR